MLAAAVLLLRFAPDRLVQEAATGYPYGVYGLGLLLAWRFQRSRVAAALLAFALVGEGLPLVSPEGGPVWFGLAALYLPAVVAGLSLLADRGVFSAGGLLQIAAVVAGAAVALWAGLDHPDGVRTLLALPGAPPPVQGLLSTVGLPPVAAAAMAVGLLVAGWAVYRWEKPVEEGLLWALVMGLLLVRYEPAAPAFGVLAMSAGVALVLAAVEASYVLAYHDDLTGLPARRALKRALERPGGVYTVAMVDVDRFKEFNDRHGHDVGDQVLAMVGARLAEVGGGGKAFRYGGEEFTVLFRGMEKEEALPHVEALREAVEESRFTLRGWTRPKHAPKEARGKGKGGRGGLSVTVSVGVAEGGRGADPDAVLKKADRALYRAKEKGRNRVEAARR